MKRLFLFATLLWAALLPKLIAAELPVTLGIDRLLEPGSEFAPLIEGKRVGLITNPSGVDGQLVPTVDRLARDPRLRLIRLFGPEHGIRGEIAAGERVADARDSQTGLPVVSLYGATKRPSREAVRDLDVLLFDIQDVGSRTYTYLSTLGEALHACAEHDVPLVVLDRPNPLGGLRFEGPLVEPSYRSFIGWGPVPVTHGMTFGEAARYFNSRLAIGCALHVVPLRGWRRTMSWADTGLLWSITSPHVPHATQAMLYTTTGMITSTVRDLNNGVGSTMPFETVAAPFIDAVRLEQALSARNLPGVRFQAIHYKPFYGRYANAPLQGVRLRVVEAENFRPLFTAVAIVETLRNLYPKQIKFVDDRTLGTHWGNTALRRQLEQGLGAEAIARSWAEEHAGFSAARQQALLYE
ncbi:MAG: DUF1343 domain-containing protein [Sinobacteraceae bacterium]|nr:DUF1343 domain-containing protein [Nevskiaceae bacterium]